MFDAALEFAADVTSEVADDNVPDTSAIFAELLPLVSKPVSVSADTVPATVVIPATKKIVGAT